MAYFTGSIYSTALHMDTAVGVILPHDSRQHRGIDPLAGGRAPRKRPRTLILLHGLSDNFAAWATRSRILSYAEDFDVAVLMPEVQRSFYQDMVNGEDYFTYVSRELPALAAELFNLSVDPEDLMVAGLSMGGYGALRCALAAPDRFRAVGAFSGAVEIEGLTLRPADRKETLGFAKVVRGIFGESPAVPEDARLDVLAERARGTKLPVMLTCGTEDALFPSNQRLFDRLKALDYDVSFDYWPGVHEWGFWDKSVRMFLERHA